MTHSKPHILADIGGTYARFATVSGGAPDNVRKYKAAYFETFEAALENYCHEVGIEKGGTLSIATAGYEDEGVWKFVNQNIWQIDPAHLQKTWTLQPILNDFEAATWALLGLEEDQKRIIRDAPSASESLCLMGPGTGLGLGYLHRTPRTYVQKTHGGHMPASAITEEQWQVIKTVDRLNRGRSVTVFEHLISGPGLFNIYAARCMIVGKLRKVSETEKLVEHRHDPEVADALRLFHEFMGLFAANAIITAHAYGGLYLTGGVLSRLEEHGLFDKSHFLKFFDLELAASVKRDLKATPVTLITYPYPALKGLLMAEKEKANA
jgi:glucokinase